MDWFGWKKRCRQLEAENRRLRERNAWLEQHVAELQAQNTQLVQSLAAAKKNSTTSSKPPSSDIVKPPPKGGGRRGKGSKRRVGAQKGHPKHERTPFRPDQIDKRIPYRLRRCPIDPSHRIVPAEDRKRVLQQVELVKNPFKVTEHIAYGIWCEDCQQYHDAPLPPEVVAGGLCGPRLTSLVCFLRGKLHASVSGIRDFLTDVVGLEVCRGYIIKLFGKASAAFSPPWEQLLQRLPREPLANVDETGHKENGQRLWTWCFRAAGFVLFHIAPSRKAEVLKHILGESFKGILGCDYYSAYHKYASECSVLVQFCMAHLIRDVKYLCEFPDQMVQRYGTGLLEGLKGLFWALHRKDQLSPQAFDKELAKAQEQVWEAALAPEASPNRFGGTPHRLIQNMVGRFLKDGEAYFQFITTPGIDPTNNVAEQAMRFVVMDRHITQGTRSQSGRRFSERLWTVMATCSLQKRSAFQWMLQAITASFKKQPIPSLLLDSS
jgi:transposase